ncbi:MULTISPECIES: glucosamine kinase [unclassified Mycobacterium]|uniref:glucosamine kinase n=1 Tax=unclassified Mycobacterium TaxID=2642494 RepID=UPI0029C9636D|nr:MULTISPECIES: glucosamine kinase [unclassified Mycobacterium]
MADAPRVLDALELAEGKRLSVVADADGLAALPMIREPSGWRRAHPGDGVAEALLARLAAVDGAATAGRFTLRSWVHRTATGERPMGVDQTNESVIVGDAAVVKWATHLQDGPHPAARRIGVLRDAGFGGMPTPWGLVTWQPTGAAETLVASVDEYLPGAVDGWTWAVELITRADDPAPAVAAAVDVGELVAEMHAGLSSTVTLASEQDAARWRERALEILETACTLGDFASVVTARARRSELETMLDGLGALAGTPVIEGHGDLHVGQVLRADGRFVVTDFDGNPVLPAAQRTLPIPAALDVAGMIQSLAHAAIVARKYATIDPAALAAADAACRAALLRAYPTRLAELGHSELFDPGPLRAFRTQQVLREIIYAARHLPRWMYVPDAALPALLDEGIET